MVEQLAYANTAYANSSIRKWPARSLYLSLTQNNAENGISVVIHSVYLHKEKKSTCDSLYYLSVWCVRE